MSSEEFSSDYKWTIVFRGLMNAAYAYGEKENRILTIESIKYTDFELNLMHGLSFAACMTLFESHIEDEQWNNRKDDAAWTGWSRNHDFEVMYQIRNVFIHHRGFLKSTNRWHDKIRQFKIDYPDKAKYYCIKQKKNRDYIFLEKSWNAKSEELLTAVIQFATTRGYWNP